MGAIEILLDHPVEIGGKIISSIQVRPPTKADLMAVHALNVSRFIRGVRLVERVVDAPREVILALDEVDQQKIEAFLREHGV